MPTAALVHYFWKYSILFPYICGWLAIVVAAAAADVIAIVSLVATNCHLNLLKLSIYAKQVNILGNIAGISIVNSHLLLSQPLEWRWQRRRRPL